ncbi:Hspa4 [Symbiodinium natans]|uniref:Hspa4 protein n=1 Tax=Symbiodinium natans TaxID=878477 RepID=A0A812KY47_9DINO|nr:Hspa4 [Symbiodinium natans]
MSRASACRTGAAGDDFVIILRHLVDPASLPQQRFVENRLARADRRGGNGVESKYYQGETFGQLYNASLQRILKCMQDFLQDAVVLVALGAMKSFLVLFTVLHFFFSCLFCFRGAHKIGLLTRRHWALSNLVYQLRTLWKERKVQRQIASDFLRRHHTSQLLSIRVQRHIDWLQLHQFRPRDPEKARRNAMTLVTEIMEEMSAPPLIEHPFFRSFRHKHPKLLNQLCCEALVPVFHCSPEVVFTVGESCSMMYVIINGQAQYAAQLPPPRDSPAGTPGTQVRKTLQSGNSRKTHPVPTHDRYIGVSFERSVTAGSLGLNRSIQSDITEARAIFAGNCSDAVIEVEDEKACTAKAKQLLHPSYHVDTEVEQKRHSRLLQQVIGIDLGTADSYVAYIRGGAIEVVQNEVSQRKTPSLVGFTDRERLLGDTALSQIKSNAKNTCRNFKHLLGQRFDSPAVEAEKFWSTCPLVQTEDGFTGYSVNYKGETTHFSATEVTAMFLTKLKQVTEAWCGAKVADAVIAVPSHFSDFQRQALLDAAAIADLHVLRVVNEHTATALEYGFFRNSNFDTEKPSTVAFCQMGHSNFSVAIVQFLKGELTVLCEKSDKVGGRDMVECLIRTFAEQFNKKTGCDVLTNKKACFKLEDAVAKTKKILSANTEAGVSCECLMEDHDFSGNVDRETFLEMCKPMMKKVSDVLEAAKASLNLSVGAIDSVEICGGAARVPWVKEMCSKAFGGKELSTTMNADECVARGCALQAAILSPLYKVQDFKVEDSCKFPISIGWQMPANSDGSNGNTKDVTSVVFSTDSVLNLLKVITFKRKGPFDLTVSYAAEKLPSGTPKDLGIYTIEVPLQDVPKKVKVKTVLTLHGTFCVQSAHLVEEEEDAPMPDAADQEASRKRKIKRTDLSIKKKGCPGLSETLLKVSKEKEERMIQDMQEVIETNARKNDLEAYILTMRSSIADGGKLKGYIKEEDSLMLSKQLESAEDWLYDHPDDPKEAFVKKLEELKVLGGPAEARHRDDVRRPELIHSLEESITRFKAASASQKPTRSITDNAKLQGLEKTCEEVQQWLAELKEKQSKLSKLDDSVLTVDSLKAKTDELVKLADSILGQGESTTPAANGKSALDVD